jgi:hypothetical protein
MAGSPQSLSTMGPWVLFFPSPSCSDLDLLVGLQPIEPGDLVQAYFGSRRDGDLFARIDQAAQIISFRNKLTHEYVTINDQLVWGVIQNNLPVLLEQCTQLLSDLERGDA